MNKLRMVVGVLLLPIALVLGVVGSLIGALGLDHAGQSLLKVAERITYMALGEEGRLDNQPPGE